MERSRGALMKWRPRSTAIVEQVVPVGVALRQPAGGGVLEEELEGGAVFVPGVEVEEAGELHVVQLGVVVGVDVVADLGREEHGPDLVVGGESDGGGWWSLRRRRHSRRGGGWRPAGGGGLCGWRTVIEGVGEALGYE